MFKAVLEFHLDDAQAAEKLLRSIEADNEGFVESELDGGTLICRVEAETAASLRHTLDDLLACADLAQSVLVKEV